MAQPIEWEGQRFALLIERDEGSYLVPPIVFNLAGELIQGVEVLQAVALTGVTIDPAVIRNATPGDLAEYDRRMKHISDRLGVPIGPPG